MNNLNSLYNFLGDNKTSVSQLRKIRAKSIIESINPGSEILIIHDISFLTYTWHHSKLDRCVIGNNIDKGYEYNCCLAIEPYTKRYLGVLHDSISNIDGPDDIEMMDYDYEPLFDDFDESEKLKIRSNHKHQAAVHVNGLAKILKDLQPIHIMDREFDDIFIFISVCNNSAFYIIRATALRNVQIKQYNWLSKEAISKHRDGHKLIKGHVCVDLQKAVYDIPVQPYKSIPLDSEGKVTDDKSAVRFAHVGIGACPIVLYRNAKRNKKYIKTKEPVDVNMVVIREIDPPQGVEPLLWVLFTNLPINNLSDMIKIAEYYESRWRVEEYFRVIKSGFEILKRRFNRADKIAKFLLLISIAVIEIFNIKNEVGLPANGYLNDQQYEKIKYAGKNLNDPTIDIKYRTFAYLCCQGGWLGRRSDPIGPKIIMKGFLSLMKEIYSRRFNTLLIDDIITSNVFNLNKFY